MLGGPYARTEGDVVCGAPVQAEGHGDVARDMLFRPTGMVTTLRVQLHPVFHCSSLNALNPGSGR